MLSGLFAVLLVGSLAGSIEAERDRGCYRTPCYPTHDRGYYGGCSVYDSYGGCGGYRGYGGYGGYHGYRGYGAYDDYRGYGGDDW